MNKKTISYKIKTKLIESLEKQENIEVLKEKSFFSKIFSSKKEFADIYFHSGIIDSDSIEKIQNSKLVIVNSQSIKHKILLQTKIDANKIEVFYPSVDVEYKKSKDIKKEFIKKLELDLNKKIILFTAKNFKTSGIKEFIQIIATLYQDNFQVIIAGDSKQITNLKFQMSNINLNNNIFLIEDYDNMDELFLLSDIFILPTYNETFASNVLKAMFCKCAVFISSINHASEVLDIFASMDNPEDRTIPFKVDALLSANDDLKQIKKENRNIALKYTLENNLQRFNEIIENI